MPEAEIDSFVEIVQKNFNLPISITPASEKIPTNSSQTKGLEEISISRIKLKDQKKPLGEEPFVGQKRDS